MKHRFKKNLGQNWLIDQKVIQVIVDTADLAQSDTVIEIGPGEGVLTARLLETDAKVIAIEKDRDLHDQLKDKFKNYPNFSLIEGDIRDINLDELAGNKPYKVVANIPYYLTGYIIRLFLSAKNQPAAMTLLLQREVADRIIAADDKASVLSLSVKVYGYPTKIINVKAGAFRPIPNVNSAVIHIDKISRDWFVKNSIAEARFFEIIKHVFNQKRKKLGSTLDLEVSDPFYNHRPEDLSLDDWATLLLNNPQL